MFFVELDDDGISSSDIKRIAHHLVDDHKNLINQLNQSQLDELSFILKPTLNADQEELELHTRWNHFITNFSIKNESGKTMRFFTDKNHLYFGDEAGLSLAQNLRGNEEYPTKEYHYNDKDDVK